MSFESVIADACYASALGEAVTYVDARLVAHAIRAISVADPEALTGFTEVGVRDAQRGFRLKKADLPARPQAGDEISHNTTTWRVDGAPVDLNETEWLVYVIDGDADG